MTDGVGERADVLHTITRVEDVGETDDVNEALQLGWVLLKLYTVAQRRAATPAAQVTESVRYVLGWPSTKGELRTPSWGAPREVAARRTAAARASGGQSAADADTARFGEDPGTVEEE